MRMAVVWGTVMRRQAVKDEAERLIEEFGDQAYYKAREAMRLATRRKNARLASYFAAVAGEVAARTGREVGMDTATRYLEG